MSTYSRHYTLHVAVTLMGVTLSAVGAMLLLCAALGAVPWLPFTPSLRPLLLAGGILLALLWVAMVVRLWKLIRFPLRQTALFIGAIDNHDSTMRFPHTSDPLFAPITDEMNRMLGTFSHERLSAEAQRQYNDRILRVMIHEMRNSITPILSLTELLQSQPVSDDERREFNTIIHRQAKDIDGFLEQYSALSRLPEPQLQAISVRDLLDKLLMSLSAEPRAECISCSVVGEPIVYVDEKLLNMALLNVVRNAMQAIGSQPDGHVSLFASGSPDEVRIVVSNNGPLVAPGSVEAIFQPFYTTKKEGSGIGLTLSRRVMELHGGTLTCSSNPPLTLFTFVFPL